MNNKKNRNWRQLLLTRVILQGLYYDPERKLVINGLVMATWPSESPCINYTWWTIENQIGYRYPVDEYILANPFYGEKAKICKKANESNTVMSLFDFCWIIVIPLVL